MTERTRDADSDFENMTREDDEIERRRVSDPNFDQRSGSASYKTDKSDGNRDSAGGARMGTDLLEWMGAGKEWDGDQGHQSQRARESRDRSDSASRNEEWNTDSNIDRTAKRSTFTGNPLLRRGIAELVKVNRRPASASASIRVRRASDSASVNSGGNSNSNNAYNTISAKNGTESQSPFPGTHCPYNISLDMQSDRTLFDFEKHTHFLSLL